MTTDSNEIKKQSETLLGLAKFFASDGRQDKAKALKKAAKLLDLASQVAAQAPSSDKAAQKSIQTSIKKANDITLAGAGIALDIA